MRNNDERPKLRSSSNDTSKAHRTSSQEEKRSLLKDVKLPNGTGMSTVKTQHVEAATTETTSSASRKQHPKGFSASGDDELHTKKNRRRKSGQECNGGGISNGLKADIAMTEGPPVEAVYVPSALEDSGRVGAEELSSSNVGRAKSSWTRKKRLATTSTAISNAPVKEDETESCGGSFSSVSVDGPPSPTNPCASEQKDRHRTEEVWQSMLYNLILYKSKHGHINVRHDDLEHRSLYRWVRKQRKHYKLHNLGKPSFLTPDRIAVLNSLEFNWNVVERRRL